MEDYVYGLDFGTSTTLIAIPRDGIPQVLPIGRTTNWLPSIIAVEGDSTFVVGDEAADFPHADQIRSPKTAITRDIYGALTSPNGNQILANEAIVAILQEVKRRAEGLGLDSRGRVRMSCPAMWTGDQRRRLAGLAQKAGINADVDSMLDEPSAAAISWWWSNYFSQGSKRTARILVFDLGGGTLDVAVADIYGESIPEISVLSARGIDLAGDHLDMLLANFYESRLISEYGLDLSQRQDYPITRNLAIRAARKVKEGLSYLESMNFELEDPDYSFLPKLDVSRLDLEMVYESDLDRAIGCVKATLKEAFLKNSSHTSEGMQRFQNISHEELARDIRYVVLAGGMSRIPIIQEKLQSLFPSAIVESTLDGNRVTESIVLGVASRYDFANLNTHRPNLNFIVKWADQNGISGERVVYPAFEPLHSDAEIFRGQFLLGYSHTWVPESNPKNQTAHLFLETLGGRKFDLTIGETVVDHISLKVFKGIPVQFKIYLDGTIMITDQIRQHSFKVKQWPNIRWSSEQALRYQLRLEIPEDRDRPQVTNLGWTYDEIN